VNKIMEMSFWDIIQLVMLCAFFFTFAYRSVGLRIRRKVNPVKFNFSESCLLGLSELVLLAGVSIWAIEVTLYSIPAEVHIFPWPFNLLLFNCLIAQSLGAFISLLAFGLLFSGLKNLGDSWRFGIDENQTVDLVTKGIYSVTRNPIYMFFNLWFLGTFLMNGTLIFLCFLLFTFVNLHFQVIKEEAFLRKVYGSAFVEYCSRTPRYFSWKVLVRSIKIKPQISVGSFRK
jgi:protein-S-isoprenylcysteine O-methyltransferase Ste14